MKSLPRGKCVIVNNEQFHDEAYNHDGANHDEKRLKDLFEELGFVVDIRRNLTRDEINKTSKDVAAEDHSNFDAFVFIIMSHGGSRDAVCGVDDRPAYVEDVMSEFKAMKCPSLRNKPKLFFIQCCRGSSTEFISPPLIVTVTALCLDLTTTLLLPVVFVHKKWTFCWPFQLHLGIFPIDIQLAPCSFK